MKKSILLAFFSLTMLGLTSCAPLPLPASAPLKVGYTHYPPSGLVRFCAANAAACAQTTPATSTAPVTLTAGVWRELEEVNWRVNRKIRPQSDLQTFGRIDHWTDRTTVGDCDDYVLMKRADLIARGWPPSALRILLADTETGERHVVLLARTDRADFILDNRFDRVTTWDRLRYRWIALQSSHDMLAWHRVAKS